jgi:hypothetical protein
MPSSLVLFVSVSGPCLADLQVTAATSLLMLALHRLNSLQGTLRSSPLQTASLTSFDSASMLLAFHREGGPRD